MPTLTTFGYRRQFQIQCNVRVLLSIPDAPQPRIGSPAPPIMPQRAATGMIGGVLSRLKEAGGVADTHATGHGAGQAGEAGAGDSPDQVRGDAQPRWLRVRPGTQRALELVEPRRDRVEPASS